jgi:hypothetical protein
MNAQILLRRGLAELWTGINPTLGDGEIGLENDTGKFKIGDGETEWTSLQYFQGEAGPAGAEGPAGPQGEPGIQGEPGPGITNIVFNEEGTLTITYSDSAQTTTTPSLIGPEGPTGAVGFTGSQGIAGEFAAVGFTGSQGTQGIIGFTGSQGIAGEFAAVGFTGSQGTQGTQGAVGFTGSQGLPGDSGSIDLSAIDQDIIPTTDITYDLGSPTNRFRDLYLSGNTINLGGATISATPSGNISLGSGSLISPNVIGTGITSITFKGVNYGLNEPVTVTPNEESGGVQGVFPFGAILLLGGEGVDGPNTVPATFEFTYNEDDELVTMTLTDPGSGYLNYGSVFVAFESFYPPATPIDTELSIGNPSTDPTDIGYKPGFYTLGAYLDQREDANSPFPWILGDGITVQPDDTDITATWTDGVRSVTLTYQRTATIQTQTTDWYFFGTRTPETALSVTGQFTSDDFEVYPYNNAIMFHIDYDSPTVMIAGPAPSSDYGQYENAHYLNIFIGQGASGGVDTSESLFVNIGPLIGQSTGSVVISSEESTPTFGSVTFPDATVQTTAYTAMSRTSVVGTAENLIDLGTANLDITAFKGYTIFKIQTSHAAWVRVYADSASRTADASRTQEEDPLSSAGVILEIITDTAETILMTPAVFGFNNEDPVTDILPIAVTNLSGDTNTITVTLTILQIES